MMMMVRIAIKVTLIIIYSTFNNTSWDARLCSGFATMYGNIMVKSL